MRKGVVNNFAIDFVDARRAELRERYKTVDQFLKDFRIDEKISAGLIAQGEKDGVKSDPAGMAKSKALIDLRVKALIARDVWDTSAYWQVINQDNPVDRSFQRALEALHDDTFQRMGFAAQ